MSKLYTEEQLKEFFKEHYFITEEDLKNFIPIQLPTDEEIENNAYSDRQVDYWEHEQQIGFQRGAKWMRDKIKGGQGE